jgi:DNA-binding CsgD family transcriptional regulator
MPRADFERSEFYNDFLVRRLGARSVLTTLLIRNRDRLVAMTLCRGGAANPGYTAHDKRVLAELIPHLERAHKVSTRLRTHEMRAARLEELLDRSPRGLLIVNAAGRVHYANRPAEQVLRRCDALAVGAGVLRASASVANDRLYALIAEAARGSGGGAVALPQRSGRGFVHALVVPCAARRTWPTAGEPCALVLLRPTQTRFRLLPEHARAIFGLSPSEARVASLLHQGLDLAAIAAALEISRNTARVHLNAILAKTGTHRQAILMQRLSAIAELYGAPGGVA